MGLTVLRFNDADVKRDMNNVLMAIEGWIGNREKTTPCIPLNKGGIKGAQNNKKD